jgi:hypothetical protein
MAEKLNIKLQIGENTYPMRIDAEEEEYFRAAQSLAQGKYKKYKEAYSDMPVEDILAMTILDLAKNNIDLREKKESISFFTELSDIVETLGDYIKAQ